MTRTPLRAAGALLSCLAATGPDACDGKHFETILHPAAALYDARAVWLDGRTIQWPGGAPAGTVKLYHAARGGIAAPQGGKVAGVDGAIRLDPFTGPVPQGFQYLAPGPVLRVGDAEATKLPDLHRGQLVLVREDAEGRVLDATRIQVAGALDDLYAAAADLPQLGAGIEAGRTRFTAWAPTAQQAAICVYDGGTGGVRAVYQMAFDRRTGA